MADQLENSILRTIKKMLGLDLDYEAFDVDIITHINTALMTLQQLGYLKDKSGHSVPVDHEGKHGVFVGKMQLKLEKK